MALYGSGAHYCDCGFWLDNISISNMTTPDYFYGLEIVFVIYCFYFVYCTRGLEEYQKENFAKQKTIMEVQKQKKIEQEPKTSGSKLFV